MALIWFRYHADALDNPRVQKLPDNLFKLWVNLQCILAQEKSAAHGKLQPPSVLAFRLRMSVEETVNKLDLLVDAGLLRSKIETPETELEGESETVGNGKQAQNSLFNSSTKKEYFLRNWEKKQYKSDVSTGRVKRFRERSRNGDETSPDQIISDTDQIISKGGDISSGSFDKKEVVRTRKYGGEYDIMRHLSDKEIEAVKAEFQGWDMQNLARQYNEAVKSGRFPEPDKPQFAFPAWVKAFTKGKKP